MNQSTDVQRPPLDDENEARLKLATVTTNSGFVFPSIYSFPPFFTKQPNPQTWSHQASLWQQLIISYCRFHRMHKFELSPSAEQLDLFNNRSISRRLDYNTISSVVDQMVEAGLAEHYPNRPTSSHKNRTPTYALIYFQPLAYWSHLIYDHITANGLTNSIMTLHELGSDEMGPELSSLDPIILKKALSILSKQGKAKIFKGTVEGVGGEPEGVKFF